MSWVAITTLLCVGAALFLLPHRTNTIVAEKRTLVAALRGLLRAGEWSGSGGKRLVRALLILACLAPFAPALCALVLRALAPGDHTLFLVFAALALLIGALLVAGLILLSHTNFGFGASRSRDGTPVAWLAPSYVALAALVALVATFSSEFRSRLLAL